MLQNVLITVILLPLIPLLVIFTALLYCLNFMKQGFVKFLWRGNRSNARKFSTTSTSSGSNNSKKVDFGYKDVDSNEKVHMVRGLFNSVATKYDVMNDVMSFGIHRLWKDEFITMTGLTAAAKANPTYIPRLLDVAGGTGDIAFRYANVLKSLYKNKLLQGISDGKYDKTEDRPIIVCDLSPEMLNVGKTRVHGQVGKENEKLVKG